MNVYISCCLVFTLLLINIIGSCQCQPTHGLDRDNCDEGDWPSKKVLVAMVDQLRDHLIASTNNMQAAIQQLTKQNQQLTTDNQQSTAQIQQLTTQVTTHNQQFTTQIQQLTTQVTTHNQQFTTQIQQLTTDNQQLTVDNQLFTTQLRQLTTDNQRFTIQIQQLTTQVTNLTTDNQQFTTYIKHLTTDNQKLTADNQQFTTQLRQLTTDNQQYTTQIQQLTTDNQQYTTQIQQLKVLRSKTQGAMFYPYGMDVLDEVSKLKKNYHQSAFSAYMTVGYLKPINDTRVTVPFSGVKYNLGDDYNSQTSVYTCPVNGVYFFVYTIYSREIKLPGRDRTWATIVVDKKSINKAFCSTDTAESIYCQGTNSITSQCNKGGTVMVETSDSRNQIYGTSSLHRTTFTGFLLYTI